MASPRIVQRLFFLTVFSLFAVSCIVCLAIMLQAGGSGTYLFVVNDLFTNQQRLLFTTGFVVNYFLSISWLVFSLRLPRYDFFNRIIAINIAVYSFFGLALSAMRLPLVSREVFVTEFLLSCCLLVAYYIVCHRLFPKLLGIFTDVDINSFEKHPSIKAVRVDTKSALTGQFEGIVSNLREFSNDTTSHFLADLAQRRVPVYDADALIETLFGRVPLAQLASIEIKSFTPPPVYGLIKRICEVTLIIICAPILTIFSLVIGIVIKLDSPGPILFSQVRTGLNGSPFTMLKFRSMYVAKKPDLRFAEKADKRVTRIGRLLRRVRLDELPQVWNVMVGDMSLIGPRPEQLEFTARFDQMIPFYGFRHTVRPGITGWAQVMYGYAASDEETRAKLEFDFFYIKHMSAWLDLVVLIKTVRTIMLGSGAR